MTKLPPPRLRKRVAAGLVGIGMVAGLGAVLWPRSAALKVTPPPEPVRTAQTDAIVAAIGDLGADGDWLVTRGYKPPDDLVVAATNIPLSHASMLDAGRSEVIEAHGAGIEVTPLREFVRDAHRVLLIRPRWVEADRGTEALARARQQVGGGYDFLGTVGLGSDELFYCSELCIWSYAPWRDETEAVPDVVEPGQLFLWGKVLYDSGDRSWRTATTSR